jgi:hypothetical protein
MAMERSALFLKAWLPIEVTVSGIVIVRWEQYSNARPPIDWILSGIIMLRNETQPLNVALFIAVIFFGIFISESLVQPLYLQPIITQYFIDNKSEIWLLFLIAHSKR